MTCGSIGVMDTKNDNRSIPELVAERKALAHRQSEINRRLEELDSILFNKIETVVAAFGIQPLSREATPNAQPVPPPLLPPIASNAMVTTARPKATPKAGEVGYVIQENVAALLREAGAPMSTNELFVRLDAAGVTIPGKDKKNNLSAHLSRSDAFERAGKGWWFAQKQEPPEGGS